MALSGHPATPFLVGGKVKFTAGPSADNAGATTFFMKVKLAP